jgi:hypothetical protein
MGMKSDLSKLVHSLKNGEIDALLTLYHNKDGISSNVDPSSYDSLVDKNLVDSQMDSEKSVVSLTDEGLSVAGSIMFTKIEISKDSFKQKIHKLPERAISCLINRVLWKDVVSKESGFVDPVTEPYALDESLWYERVLLKDERIENLLEQFYGVLEDFDFIRNVDDQWWCSPEVESFLKEEYKDVMGLSWAEEDSLKYYYFFYIYAQDQRNLINFTGEGEEYKSQFFGENTPPDYWFSSNRSDPRQLISSLAISEPRAINFLEEMNTKNIVNERYYPLSSFSFFSEDDKIFVIKDIKAFMEYISNKFLQPVVNQIIS